MLRIHIQKPSTYLWIAITGSLLLSLIINHQIDLINPDAICYLSSAETIAMQGLHAGMTICGQAKWPLYSILIATFAKLTHFSVETVAYGLDGFFTSLTIVFYLLIIHQLGATQRILGWGVLIILLSPTLNSVREYIIRDHGYWAFYLVSFYLVLRFVETPKLTTALCINLSLIGAALFRVEGLLFLLGVPLVVWLMPFSWQKKLHYYLQLNFITLSIITLLAIWLVTQPQESLSKLGRLNDVVHHLQNGFNLVISRYQTTKAALINHVLNTDSVRHADSVLVLMLLSWYLFNVINSLSWTYLLILAVGFWWQRWVFPYKYLAVLSVYLFFNLCITFSFFLEKMFLSKRYLVALSLVLLLMIPFAWDSLWQKMGKLRVFVGLILLSVSIISTLHYFNLHHTKQYIREAASWIKTNVPPEAQLYSNDYQLMYYTEHYGDQLFATLREFSRKRTIETLDLKHYDYLAFRIYKYAQPPLTLSAIPKETVKQFSNKNGESVIIYKVQK